LRSAPSGRLELFFIVVCAFIYHYLIAYPGIVKVFVAKA